jgi:hypothetical protein
MLEFITSKIAMMMAAIIILTSVLAVFTMIREDAEDLKLRNTADSISDTISNINSINGETKEIITFDKDMEGIYLEPEIDGKEYEIKIYQNRVMVRQDDDIFIEKFVGKIHLWEPEDTTYDQNEIQDQDEENHKLSFLSHENLIIDRRLIELEGENGYMTFVYLLHG